MLTASGSFFSKGSLTRACVASLSNGSTGVGLDDNTVATAGHNYSISTVSANGVLRTVSEERAHPEADIRLLILNAGTAMAAAYPSLPRAADDTGTGQAVKMGGSGQTATVGGAWTNDGTEHWGTNATAAATTNDTLCIQFDNIGGTECQACMNDSGSGITNTDGTVLLAVAANVGPGTAASPGDNTLTSYGATTTGPRIKRHVAWFKARMLSASKPAILDAAYNDTTTIIFRFDRTCTYNSAQIGTVKAKNSGGTVYTGSSAVLSGTGTSTLLTVTLTATGSTSVLANEYEIGAGLVTASGLNNDAIDVAPISSYSASQPPAVSGTDTNRNTMSVADIQIAPAAGDVLATHFKITAPYAGAVYKNDLTTVVADGTFITKAEADAGLAFMPTSGFTGTAHFLAASSQDGSGTGLSSTTQVNINVLWSPGMAAPSVASAVLTLDETKPASSAQLVSAALSWTNGDAPSWTAAMALGDYAVGGAFDGTGIEARIPMSGAETVDLRLSDIGTEATNPSVVGLVCTGANTQPPGTLNIGLLADMYTTAGGNNAAQKLPFTMVASRVLTITDGSGSWGTANGNTTAAVPNVNNGVRRWYQIPAGKGSISVQASGTVVTVGGTTCKVEIFNPSDLTTARATATSSGGTIGACAATGLSGSVAYLISVKNTNAAGRTVAIAVTTTNAPATGNGRTRNVSATGGLMGRGRGR
jgi:hypothetical protein